MYNIMVFEMCIMKRLPASVFIHVTGVPSVPLSVDPSSLTPKPTELPTPAGSPLPTGPAGKAVHCHSDRALPRAKAAPTPALPRSDC